MSLGFARAVRGRLPFRMALVALAAGWALVSGAPAADAHSVLLSRTQAKDAEVTTSPAEVALVFNEPVENRFTELALLGPDGSHWEAGPASIVDARVSAPVRPLGAAGTYTIHSRATSANKHQVSGDVPFRLTVAGLGTAVPAAAATTATVPDRPAPLWPWITGGAVLLGTGIAVARRVARTPAAPGAGRG